MQNMFLEVLTDLAYIYIFSNYNFRPDLPHLLSSTNVPTTVGIQIDILAQIFISLKDSPVKILVIG